jgi:quinol monooxygenase YgiN
MTITFNGTLTDAEDNPAEFNRWLAKARKTVREKERGQTLVYQDTKLNAKSPIYRVIEAYTNVDALLAHVKNLGNVRLGPGARVIQFQVVVTGDVPPDKRIRQPEELLNAPPEAGTRARFGAELTKKL